MRRRAFMIALGDAALGRPYTALAQAVRPLLGYLYAGRAGPNAVYASAFLDGMRELGYSEGRDFDLIYRYGDDDYARLPALATELVVRGPTLILAAEPPAALAASKATSSIPIVGALLADPIGQGLIASYAHPGGNVTGILVSVDGQWGKFLELARELVPNAATIGLLINPTNAANAFGRKGLEAAGAAAGVRIVTAEAAGPAEFAPAFARLRAASVQAVIIGGDATFVSERTRLVALAAASHLPAVFGNREFVTTGGLVSYSVSNTGNYHRAAYFADRILKGAKPADLPVEFPTKLELVVNLKAAKAQGIAIPATMLSTADEVIE